MSHIYDHVLHNGRFISKEAAHMPVYTPALVGALGVYETILVKNGRYVALREHLERLLQSAEGAQLALKPDLTTLIRWCRELVEANAPDGLVRVLVMDLGRAHADVFLYEMSYAPPTPEEYAQGVPVILYHGERAMPLIKSFNTLVPGLARKAARAAGVHDALLVDRDGYVTEGSNCNVFIVQDGVLAAPPLGAVLEGTVMRRVMSLARELGIPFQRRPLPSRDIPRWNEVFLTSTRRGVLPVRRVGDVEIGPPGPITRQLMEAYRAWEAEELAANRP
jgi:branched-subunit amino acid aminotransferase/4-amino-4-deoxychorismate lyase